MIIPDMWVSGIIICYLVGPLGDTTALIVEWIGEIADMTTAKIVVII